MAGMENGADVKGAPSTSPQLSIFTWQLPATSTWETLAPRLLQAAREHMG